MVLTSGMLDMWRVWKRRRGRMRDGGTKAASAAKDAAKDAAGRAGENFSKVMKVNSGFSSNMH